jgi:hypothetical protein
MGFLSDEERAQLSPAEDLPHRFPIQTQIVSSDEYFPERPADGPVKRGIFAPNGFRIFGYDHQAELARPDRFAALKEDYLRNGADPSDLRCDLRYGYVRRA